MWSLQLYDHFFRMVNRKHIKQSKINRHVQQWWKSLIHSILYKEIKRSKLESWTLSMIETMTLCLTCKFEWVRAKLRDSQNTLHERVILHHVCPNWESNWPVVCWIGHERQDFNESHVYSALVRGPKTRMKELWGRRAREREGNPLPRPGGGGERVGWRHS